MKTVDGSRNHRPEISLKVCASCQDRRIAMPRFLCLLRTQTRMY